MACPIPQPGQRPTPSNLDTHNVVSPSVTGIKNKIVSAAIQQNNSRLPKTFFADMIITDFILCNSFVKFCFPCSSVLKKVAYGYLPNAAILVLKIFTAIAISITPKNLRTASKPASPSIRSISFSDFNTMYTTTRLINIPASI